MSANANPEVMLRVWGPEDRVTPTEIAERFHALVPDCERAPMLEHPAIFADRVRQWLRDTAPCRAGATRGCR